jgi:hypothetical protein
VIESQLTAIGVSAFLLLGLAAHFAGAREVDTVRLAASKDTSLSSHADEREQTRGAADRLKLKYLEEMGLVAFDPAPLAGRKVLSAHLYMHCVPETTRADMARLGIPGSLEMPMRYIGVSTVSGEWREAGATFNEAIRGEKPWAWKGSRLWDVIFGCGNSAHSSREIEKLGDYWWRVEIDPAVMETLAAGGGDGLCIMEESNAPWELSPNNFIHTRESGEFAPYLEVETARAGPPPQAPEDLVVKPAPLASTLEGGAVEVSLAVPSGAVCYRVEIDGAVLEPWMVARPAGPGERQAFVIRDLAADREVKIALSVVGAGGLQSPRRVVRARTSKRLARPRPAVAEFAASETAVEPRLHAGRLRVWAYPENVKLDPVSGEFIAGAAPGETPGSNSVWDASSGRVTLAAARGEIAAFQLAVSPVGGPLEKVLISTSNIESATGRISREWVRLYREWYVKPRRTWIPEIAVPLSGPVSVPSADNKVEGQRWQSFWVDICVPKGTPAGRYRGKVVFTAEGVAEFEMPIELEVHDAVIPDEINFWAELNGYGAPGGAGTPYYYEAHRIAHFNRCCINIVPYRQGRNADPLYRPALEGRGRDTRAAGWGDFDRVQGPLLDGSAFRGMPRDGVPVKVFYLPLYEYWPAPFLENYAFDRIPAPESINLNYLTAPPLEEGVGEDFRVAWKNVVPEFTRHFREKGWTDTIFECYFNNKWHMSKTMFWNLDEPAVREDYRAIAFFARLFREARGDSGEVKMLYRGDISRPQWQFDDFNGLMDIEYVNMGVVDMVRTVRETNRRAGSVFVVYGHANEITRSDLETVQWCFSSYVCGALGVLPWNSFDATDAFTKGSRNGLIIDGSPAGHPGPVSSLRVFAFRRGVQDVELLRMYAERKGWTRDQMAVFINAFVPLGAEFTQSFTDEAAAGLFEEANAYGLIQLRKTLLAELSAR